jgi:GntR family transcriptional regulator, transcriptional repressor for pyruvate dehydrogenase complex
VFDKLGSSQSHLHRPKAADVMVHEVIGMLAGGDLRPGDRLGSESDLIQRFGFSRAVVREALRVLEREGVVAVKPGPNGGIFCEMPGVAQITRSIDLYGALHDITTEDLAEARLELEVVVARLAAVRRTEDDLAALERLNSDWIANIANYDRDGAAQVNVEFHIALTQAAHNPVFTAIMDALEGLLYRTALGPQYPVRQLDYVVNAHEYVLRPIREKDADQAAAQMRRHLEIFRPLWWREIPEAHLQLGVVESTNRGG